MTTPATQNERMARYQPAIFTQGADTFHYEDHPQIQSAINDDPTIDYCRTTTGEIWRIRRELNKKSVPLNDASIPPAITRLAYDKITSFGRLVDKETTELPDVEDFHKAKGITWEETPVRDDGGELPAPSPGLAKAITEQAEAGRAGHKDRAHAVLSASGAHRWLNCTPSARLEDQLPDSTSEAAEQGTAAHELAEWKLAGRTGTRPESDWHDEEMEDHTDTYVDHVTAELARAQEASPAAFLAIEERLNFSHLVPDGFGTGDAVIVGDGTMTIVDLKYGKGVEVNAIENPQMMLYALGALNTYGMIYDIRQVRMVIYQPRRHNISVWETTVQDLLDWAEQVVKPTAQLAHAGQGELKAGDWCQFCRHAPQCSALAAQHFQVVPTKELLTPEPAAPAPDTLTDEQIAQIVRHSGAIKKWLTSVEKHALETANSGRTYPGLKLVEGRATRKYADEAAVATKVTEAGHDPWKPRELIGITDMTKLLGKKQFNELVGPLLHKPAGAPTLAPEDDKRPALTIASPETVFQQIS